MDWKKIIVVVTMSSTTLALASAYLGWGISATTVFIVAAGVLIAMGATVVLACALVASFAIVYAWISAARQNGLDHPEGTGLDGVTLSHDNASSPLSAHRDSITSNISNTRMFLLMRKMFNEARRNSDYSRLSEILRRRDSVRASELRRLSDQVEELAEMANHLTRQRATQGNSGDRRINWTIENIHRRNQPMAGARRVEVRDGFRTNGVPTATRIPNVPTSSSRRTNHIEKIAVSQTKRKS